MKRGITVAKLIDGRIKLSGKTQREIAEDLGYPNANIISMFKQGLTKLPTSKVEKMANSLDVSQIEMLELVLKEYTPETYDAMRSIYGELPSNETEAAILKAVKQTLKGKSIDMNNSKNMALLTKTLQRLVT